MSGRLLSCDGTVPERSVQAEISQLQLPPSSGGMVPDISLLDGQSCCSSESLPGGMVPEILLLYSQSWFNPEMPPRCGGMMPERSLLDSRSCCKIESSPVVGGRVPEISLLSRWSFASPARALLIICGGMVPEMRSPSRTTPKGAVAQRRSVVSVADTPRYASTLPASRNGRASLGTDVKFTIQQLRPVQVIAETGSLAQLGERQTEDLKVPSSILGGASCVFCNGGVLGFGVGLLSYVLSGPAGTTAVCRWPQAATWPRAAALARDSDALLGKATREITSLQLGW